MARVIPVVLGAVHHCVLKHQHNYKSYIIYNNKCVHPSFSTAAVNGLVYGNLRGLEMCQGERVVWYIFGMGTEGDIHGVHFEGNTFQRQSTTRDTANVFPHTTATLTMQPQSLGEVSAASDPVFHVRFKIIFFEKSECRQAEIRVNRASLLSFA